MLQVYNFFYLKQEKETRSQAWGHKSLYERQGCGGEGVCKRRGSADCLRVPNAARQTKQKQPFLSQFRILQGKRYQPSQGTVSGHSTLQTKIQKLSHLAIRACSHFLCYLNASV